MFTRGRNGGRFVLAVLAGAVAAVCCAASSRGQVIYVNNNINSPGNSVSGLAISPTTGALTPVPGSPFDTGGTGDFAPNIDGVDILALGPYLYATNSVSNSVAAFTINSDGTLSTIPGSPFPTLGMKPNGIAVNSAGTLLFVTNFQSSNVSVFDIDPTNGALTLVAPPFTVAGQPLATVIDSADSLLFVSHFSPTNAVGVYTIGAGGSSLSAIAGSPFGAGGGERGMDVNAAHTLLYVADGSANTVSGFSIGGGGTLTSLGSSATGTEPTGVLFHPSPSLNVLYVSNDVSNDIDVFTIGGGGTLSPLQTGVASGGNGTAGMVIDPASGAHGRLFAINGGSSVSPSRNVSVFDISATGTLSAVSGSPFATASPALSAGTPSAIALAGFPRATCTANTPELCIPGGGTLSQDCYAEWLVSMTPPPNISLRTHLPINRVSCQNGNPLCDFDGSATDTHCTFHVQVCFNNQDPHFTCPPASQLLSYELSRPRPNGTSNDASDNLNVAAFEAAVNGKSCVNAAQTRSCLSSADCVGGAACTDPPVVGLPIVQGRNTLLTGAPSTTLNNCSNVMSIQVPLRSTSNGLQAKTKIFLAKVRTATKVVDQDMLYLTCLPAP